MLVGQSEISKPEVPPRGMQARSQFYRNRRRLYRRDCRCPGLPFPFSRSPGDSRGRSGRCRGFSAASETRSRSFHNRRGLGIASFHPGFTRGLRVGHRTARPWPFVQRRSVNDRYARPPPVSRGFLGERLETSLDRDSVEKVHDGTRLDSNGRATIWRNEGREASTYVDVADFHAYGGCKRLPEGR